MKNDTHIPIVFLHGWGTTMSGDKYAPVRSLLEKKGYTVYCPDLPGFGTNPLPKKSLVFGDYIAFVYSYITKTIKAKQVILIGHSFGGRIAIRFTKEHPQLVKKLILTGASGIVHPLSGKKLLASYLAKIGKPLFSLPIFSLFYQVFRKALYRFLGEMDYYKSANLQETFKNVYAVSIVADLSKISVPTLLIWGEKDTFTPLADGETMHKKMLHSQLHVVPDASHRLPYENPQAFTKEVLSFL